VADEFVHRVDVRYLEVDAQGVVFNMWYLAYVDDAMTGFLSSLGVQYPDLIASGHDVQVVHANLDWRGGLRWQDQAEVGVRPVQVGTTSFRLAFDFRRGGETMVTAELVYVCVATDGSGKCPIPDALRAGLTRTLPDPPPPDPPPPDPPPPDPDPA
jgi:acyl-CoA thioester hydrolase